jgi:hypothetical protein
MSLMLITLETGKATMTISTDFLWTTTLKAAAGAMVLAGLVFAGIGATGSHHPNWIKVAVGLIVFGVVAGLVGFIGPRMAVNPSSPDQSPPPAKGAKVINRKSGRAFLVRPKFRGDGTAVDNAGDLVVDEGDFD